MLNKNVWIAAGIIMLLSLVPPAYSQQDGLSPSTATVYVENFEWKWLPDHYLECEQDDVPCWPLDWKIMLSDDVASSGQTSLKFYLNGDHDDGSIWIKRFLKAAPHTSFEVAVSFKLWSPDQSDVNTWPVLAYVGTREPETAYDFVEIGQTNWKEGWKRYTYRQLLSTDENGEIWVAMGIHATWENTRSYYIDSAVITVDAQTPGTIR
jgi:hypothetical protein